MPFAVPEPKRSKGQDMFEFGPEADPSKYKVKKLKYLPMGTVEALSTAGDDDRFSIMLALFGKADSPSGKFVRGLDAEQFSELFKAYEADSSVSAEGDSPAS